MYLYTTVDKEYNVKNTVDRFQALSWVDNLFTRDGQRLTRKVLFDKLGSTGIGTINLYEEGNTDKDWKVKLTRTHMY